MPRLDGELLDLGRSGSIGLLNGRRVEPLALRSRDFVTRRILLALEALDFRNQSAADKLEGCKFFEHLVGINTPVSKAGSDGLHVVANKCRVEHVCEDSVTPMND